MTKQKRSKGLQQQPSNNPVAKFAWQFNQAKRFADQRQYRRQAKHRGLEPFAIVSSETIAKGLVA